MKPTCVISNVYLKKGVCRFIRFSKEKLNATSKRAAENEKLKADLGEQTRAANHWMQEANQEHNNCERLKTERDTATVKALERARDVCRRRSEQFSENPHNGYVEEDTNAFIWTNDEAEYCAIELDETADAIQSLINAEKAQGGKHE